MHWKKEQVKKILVDEIKKLYNIEVEDLDKNLLSLNLRIPIEDVLFLFESVKNNYNIDLYSIVEHNNFEIFTINNLAKKIAEK